MIRNWKSTFGEHTSPLRPMTHIPLFSQSFFSSPRLPHFPFSPFPLEVGPLNPARGLGKRVQAEPGSQTIITGFWAENCLPVRAILRAHSQKICLSLVYLQATSLGEAHIRPGHYYQRQLTD